MSAIWGIISKNNAILDKHSGNMDSSMAIYKIDRIDAVDCANAHFACGHQYFTKESRNDISPIYDKNDGIMFAADCLLCNRDSVIEGLENTIYASEALDQMGDAQLLYYSYRAWGDDFVEKVRGSFSAAIYQEKENKLVLFTDHLARRYLAYHIEEAYISFGTVYTPIKECLKTNIRLNSRVIAELYADVTPLSFRKPTNTVYEGISHVNCSCQVTINTENGEMTEKQYWMPKWNKKNIFESDDECKETFRNKFKEVVSGLLRSDEEIGIKLSGGLDSASVAAFACPLLAKKNKKLYSYTSVPSKDYQYINNKLRIENEEYAIWAQKAMYSNLEPRFISGDEGNCFTHLAEYQKLFESPVKVAGNIDNIIRMLNKSREDGCRIMLAGSHGNASISYGNTGSYMYMKITSGHPILAYKAMVDFCRRERIPRKRYAFLGLKSIFKNRGKSDLLKLCYLNEKSLKQYGGYKILKDFRRNGGNGFFLTRRQRYSFIYNKTDFQHMGFYDTYTSLLTGVQSVDPTMTVEMIEFCLNIPVDYWVKNGKERRTVRDYLEDLLPIEVSAEEARGIQSPDCAFRVNRDWKEVKDIVFSALNNHDILEFIDEKKLDDLTSYIEENQSQLSRDATIFSCVLSSLGLFLKSYKSCE